MSFIDWSGAQSVIDKIPWDISYASCVHNKPLQACNALPTAGNAIPSRAMARTSKALVWLQFSLKRFEYEGLNKIVELMPSVVSKAS